MTFLRAELALLHFRIREPNFSEDHIVEYFFDRRCSVADLGGGMGGCIPPTSLKVTILAEKSASVSNNSAPFRDASPPPT